MDKKYFLGLDQGTTGTTVLILDENWDVYSDGYGKHQQYYPKNDWVEHDPLEIWESTKEAVAAALSKGDLTIDQITVMGIANQGETVVVWDKVTGNPVYNAIVWQDRRTAAEADQLNAEWRETLIEKVGYDADAYFSALKIQWILNHVPGVRERAEKGELLAGTVDAWLIWKMTAGSLHMTDYSTASRTMLLNLATGQWDEEILAKLEIPLSLMPAIKNSSDIYGKTDPEMFLGGEVVIGGNAVDQQAALFGQTCFEPGSVKTTYGTGAFMLMNIGAEPHPSENGLLLTVAWGLKQEITYALDGGIYIAGAAVNWLNTGIELIANIKDTSQMAASVPNTEGLVFVPAFVGLAAPHWDQYARGLMIGITASTKKEHIVRATLESVAYQVKDNMDVMERDSGQEIKVMRVDGGLTENEFLMQFQADILGVPIDVPVIKETTALGAAYLAGLAIGEFTSLSEIASKWQLKKRYLPQQDSEKTTSLMARWQAAVERSKNWAKDS